MKSLNIRTLLLAGSVLSVLAAPAIAQAQATGSSDASAGGVQEIVVTAQRKSQTLLSVPLSITAASGEQLAETGIKQITDLQFTTPGFNVSDSSGYTQVFIRGVGNAIFVGADPSVATFIDDVPRIYGSMVNNFVDVERVEILKGAQGGLYGRNATGGVINIITKQPTTDEVKGDLRVSYGTKKTFQAAGYINLPINDKIAISFAAERRSRSPYLKNLASPAPYSAANFPSGAFLPTGAGGAFAANTPAQTAAFFNSGIDNRGLSNEDFWAADTKLLLKPTDNLKITIAADYNNKDDRSGNNNFLSTPAFTQNVVVGNFTAFGIATNFPPGFITGNPKKFTVTNGYAGFVQNKDYGVSGTVVWNLPGVDLTSITAYRNQHTAYTDELQGANIALSAAAVDNHKHFTYQELRAISTMEGPLQLIGGATYLNSSLKASTDISLLIPFLEGLPLARATDRVKNYSIYGQGAYDFTDHITLTVSGRYIHEKNSYLSGLSGAAIAQTEHKFLPSATLNYKLDGGGTVYARWARGFKSGGINVVADITAFPNPATDGGTFKGETIDTYEAGYRGTFFDRKVQFTSSVFYNDYKNIQTNAYGNAANANTIILALINAGSARTYGVEGSLTWRVIKPLTLSINGGYLNAKYKTFQLLSSTVLNPFNHSGEQMTNSPKYQASFSADVDQPVTDGLRLVGNLLVQHTSSQLYSFNDTPGLPNAVGPSYWLANARIGVRTTDDKYGFAVFANNLFNNAYITNGIAGANGNQLDWGNPRIIGAELSAKF